MVCAKAGVLANPNELANANATTNLRPLFIASPFVIRRATKGQRGAGLILQSLKIHPLSAAHTPQAVRADLVAAEHTRQKVHVPSAGGIVRHGSCRPEVEARHGKRMASW